MTILSPEDIFEIERAREALKRLVMRNGVNTDENQRTYCAIDGLTEVLERAKGAKP